MAKLGPHDQTLAARNPGKVPVLLDSVVAYKNNLPPTFVNWPFPRHREAFRCSSLSIVLQVLSYVPAFLPLSIASYKLLGPWVQILRIILGFPSSSPSSGSVTSEPITSSFVAPLMSMPSFPLPLPPCQLFHPTSTYWILTVRQVLC